ncbi:hypothetical protein IWW48_002183 [Coemansia sp. RSA 1200]|nr:hypothetical protein IWW48_002183 [Coemansia sp. RSA 1200]
MSRLVPVFARSAHESSPSVGIARRFGVYRDWPRCAPPTLANLAARRRRQLSSMRPELKPPPHNSAPVRSTKGQLSEHHQCSTTPLHQHITDIVQRAKDLTEQKWNSKSEAEALSLLAECEKAVSSDRYYHYYNNSNSNSTSSAATDDRLTVSVFQAADRLGRKLVSSTDPYVPVALLVRYLEFYARLARPDITQRTLVNNRWWRWTQTPASVYSAQQLALLRFSVDRATVSASPSSYSNYLRKTALLPGSTDLKALADLVNSRLADYRSAEDVTNDVVRRYRMLRLLIKVVEYTVFVTLVLIVGKWLLAENAVLFATTDIVERMTIVATTVSLLALAFHVLLRYSMVGSLITPPPPINVLSSARSWRSRFLLRGRWFRGPAAGSRISLENDLRAREILRTAFPAAPAIDATAELRELLKTPSSNPLVPPRMSWQLRLALGWSRLARLFAVVEPMFVGEHGLSQRLALMWLRNLVQMVPPHHPNSSPADVATDIAATDVISGELQRFTLFVKRNFESTPFALAAHDLQAASAFVAAHADPAAMEAFLELFTGGYVGLRHGSKSGNSPTVSDRLDYMINFAMEPISRAGQSLQASGFERSKPADIQKCTKSAVVMSFGTIISQLCWRHAHNHHQQQQQQAGPAALVVAVNAFLDTPAIPVSAALYRSAFSAAADVLRDLSILRSLVASFEQRFLDGDQYVLRIVRRAHTPQSVGWKLPSVAPPTNLGAQNNLLVDCVSPYVAYLAQEEEVAAVSVGLVDLPPQNSGSVVKTDSVADFVERWSKLGILDTKSCVQCLSTAVRSVATPKANSKHLLASTAEQWVLLGFRVVDSALSAKEPVSPLGRENVMQAFYQFLELTLRASTTIEASATQHNQQCDVCVCVCVYTKWKELVARYPIVATRATAPFNSLLVRALSGNHPQQSQSQSRERVRWVLEVLDLMHGLGQTPTLQALDALCLAASRVRVDVSHQIDYWTHSIKTKARTRDTKMNRFAKSLF